MRIVTRGDFDGLASSVLLTEVETIGEIRFVHPKDAQDGKVSADSEDIVVNLPYLKGCGLWFDHHVSEKDKFPESGYEGRFEMAPSCARVIYNYYKEKGQGSLDRFNEMLTAADALDSAQLTMDQVTNPSGWILLGLTLDPRSGLGPEFRQYFRWLVEYVKELPMDKVIKHPEVKKRTDRVLNEQAECKELLSQYAKLDGKVIVTDLRTATQRPIGNRFLIYTIFPEGNVEMRIFPGFQGITVIAVGHSIFNRTCNVDVGNLLSRYGGGGHRGAGTCQLPKESAETSIAEIRETLKANLPT